MRGRHVHGFEGQIWSCHDVLLRWRVRGSALLAALLLLLRAATLSGAEKPNILFLLADDLGYGDLGCYGCPDIKTPHLDALARQGVRLTSYYANGPECTPTRTALMTGRYQQRVGGLECAIGVGNVGRYPDAVRLANQHELGLPPAWSVLPQGLKQAGLATAICGKWHLGYEPKFLPLQHGFDYAFTILGGNADYFHHTEVDGTRTLYLNDRPVQRHGYLTDLIADEARQFIQRMQGRPFFLYVPFTAPHSPFQGPGDAGKPPFSAENGERGSRDKYREMVERMDDRIGQILKALDETGAAAGTLVIFASDNGGPQFSRNAPFSGRKGTTYEGGIRVPCIVRWPGRLPAGRESSQAAITFDLTASLLAAAGATSAHPLDGIDIVAHLASGRPDFERTLYWRKIRGDETWRGVRAGSLKLIVRQDGDRRQSWLFDLAADPGEKQDLSAARPAEAERLADLLARWETEVRPAR